MLMVMRKPDPGFIGTEVSMWSFESLKNKECQVQVSTLDICVGHT
jgi:hypothetical protein